MKNLFKLLYKGLIFMSLVMILSCSSDDDNDDSSSLSDPSSFCTIELCSTSEVAKQVCIDEYNDCVALGQFSNEDCKTFAVETCTL